MAINPNHTKALANSFKVINFSKFLTIPTRYITENTLMAINKLPVLTVFLLAVVSLVAVPTANAQLGLGGLLGLIKIQGGLFCTADANVAANSPSTPVFPNAGVQLQCGPNKIVVSTARTDASGIFSILLDPLQFILTTLLSDCHVAITTPLSTCNAALPSVGGLLTSPLKIVSSTVFGLLNITNLGLVGFGPTN